MWTLSAYYHGRMHTDLKADQLDSVLEVPDSVIWLDITTPDDSDMELLAQEFHFHPLAIEDATRSHERPKVDMYNSYYFVVFYAVENQDRDGRIHTSALNLFMGRNFLVTVHPEPIHDIQDTLQRWQAPTSPLQRQVGVLVHALLDAIVDDYFPLMDQIADRVEDLEDAIFAHFDDSSIATIFSLKKDLLTMRRTIAPERDVINVLLRRQIPVFQNEEMAYLQDIYDHIVRVTDNIDTFRDLLSSALDSYLSLQSNNLNQIMKLLTMASIVLMSNALIAGIYGMNFHYMPELSWRFGYVWALGLMVAVSTTLILYFRRNHWL